MDSEKKTSAISPRKYDFIDSLRGLAILGVILLHTSQIIPPASKLLKLLGDNGAQGVQLFFITSALTLFLSMGSRSQQEAAPTRNFFIRRFFRIAPMYYLALVFFFLLDGLSARYWAPHGLSWWYPLMTIGFLNGYHPEMINSVVPGGWSITVEMTFYLLLPFLFIWLKDIKSTVLFILFTLILGWELNKIMTLIYAPLYTQDEQYLVNSFTFFWFFSQLPVFGLGILVYHVSQKIKNQRDQNLGLLLLLAAFFLIAAFLDTHTYSDLLPHHVLISIAFACLTLGLFINRPWILVNPVTVWIGKLSFSMYLIHFAILRLVNAVFPDGFPIQGSLGMLLGYLLIVVFAAGLSVITYNLIERPGIELGSSIIQRLEAAQAVRRLRSPQ